MNVADAFPHRVCINLDRRADRWRRIQERFARNGLGGVVRVAAVDGREVAPPPHWQHTAGAYGCLRSHLAVIEEARRKRWQNVLIFEDDVVFADELQAKLGACLDALPADWDMLFLGALHKEEPLPIGGNLARLTRANSTYAYAVRETVYDAFIDLNRRAENVLDDNNYALQERFNAYCCMPHLAWVESDWSDAQAKLEQHWYLAESLVLFGAGIDRLLAETAIVLAHDGTDAANVDFLVEHYRRHFGPFARTVVVGPEPAGGFDRERAFAAGLEQAGDRRFAVLADADLFLEPLDFRANLRMCERYASATGFSTLIELTAEESVRLRATGSTRGLTRTQPSPAGVARGHYRFVNRSLQVTPPMDRFESPNHALRLR